MERQLLFLLDYDLRMEESELLQHFAPFLRRPIASTSSNSAPSASSPSRARTSSVDARMEECYPVSPVRASAAGNTLMTPSASPHYTTSTSRGQQPSLNVATLTADRVSPSGSSSSNESGLTEDRGTDSEDDEDDSEGEMGADSHLYHSAQHQTSLSTLHPSQQQLQYQQQQQQRRAPSPLTSSSAKYAHGPIPTSRRTGAGKSSSAPITPTDELSQYSLESGMRSVYASRGSVDYGNGKGKLPFLSQPLQVSLSNGASTVFSSQNENSKSLRQQRSGSFLRILEVGKGMLGGGSKAMNRDSNSHQNGDGDIMIH